MVGAEGKTKENLPRGHR